MRRSVLGLILVCIPAAALADVTITVLDVGQGDATLVQSSSGKTLLFDGGPSGRGTSGALFGMDPDGNLRPKKGKRGNFKNATSDWMSWKSSLQASRAPVGGQPHPSYTTSLVS